jgi:hypothetical protein
MLFGIFQKQTQTMVMDIDGEVKYFNSRQEAEDFAEDFVAEFYEIVELPCGK